MIFGHFSEPGHTTADFIIQEAVLSLSIYRSYDRSKEKEPLMICYADDLLRRLGMSSFVDSVSMSYIAQPVSDVEDGPL